MDKGEISFWLDRKEFLNSYVDNALKSGEWYLTVATYLKGDEL